MRPLPQSLYQKNINGTDRGFTLLELIVVVALISIMFFFVVPRFAETAFTDDTFRTSQWIVNQAGALREAAIAGGADRFLVIDMDDGRLWVADCAADAETHHEQAEDRGLRLPEGQRITGVTAADGRRFAAGRAVVRFSPDGYATGALIHLAVAGGEPVSLEIEAFLPEVRIRRGGVS